MVGAVCAAVSADLRRIEPMAQQVGCLGLVATAQSLAARLDDPGTSPTAAASVARSLREVLDRLRELVPEAPAADRLDELASRRARG